MAMKSSTVEPKIRVGRVGRNTCIFFGVHGKNICDYTLFASSNVKIQIEAFYEDFCFIRCDEFRLYMCTSVFSQWVSPQNENLNLLVRNFLNICLCRSK